MGKYWRCGLAAAGVAFGAHGAWAQNVVGCPEGHAMQSSNPSGKNITCVPIPDTAALQQQITNETAARQAADSALSARIDALTEADIVGKWSVSGTTNCLQSSTGFSASTMSPVVPGPGLPSAFVSQLAATSIGTRTFAPGGTGRSVGTTHALLFPGTFHGTLVNPPPPPASPFFAGVGTGTGGASVAGLDAGFTWHIQADGTLRIDDDSTIAQPFTAPPARVGFTATIENLPPFVGHISKDRRTIVMTHPAMQPETSVTRDLAGTETNRTQRFCMRHRVLTRLD